MFGPQTTALASLSANWRLAAAAPVLLIALGAPIPRPFDAASIPPAASHAVPRGAVPAPALPIGFLDFHVSGRRPADLAGARAINARIPIARVPARAAPPFFVSGTIPDRARATDCLAAAGYYEAGDDLRGQRAVMQVVLNRMRNPAYPQSVCGVVFQGAERRTGCQFTFTCDGSMTRHHPSPLAWERARRAAIEALNGFADASVGHATHYHTDWVHPYWSATLDKIAAVDTHLFFQANAARPGNFAAFYAGAEPRIARLAALSAAHGDVPPTVLSPDLLAASAAAALSALPPLPPPATPLPERLPDQAEAPGEGIFLVTLDAGADAESFRRLAEARCGTLSRCKLIGWTDASRRVDRFPLPGRAIDAIAFSFSRASAAVAGKAQWDCRQFPRSLPSECLRRDPASSNNSGAANQTVAGSGM